MGILTMGLLAGLMIGAIAPQKTEYTSKELNLLPHVVKASQKYDVEPQLILAHIYTESAFNPKAKRHEYGKEYSYGAMQVLSKTAESLAGKKMTEDELLNPTTNIDLGTKYIKQNLDRYKGNYADAIAAYNAGSAMKDAKGQYVNTKGIPIVQKYVNKVVTALDMYRAGKTPMKYSLAAYLPSVVTENLWLWALGGVFIGAIILIPRGK